MHQRSISISNSIKQEQPNQTPSLNPSNSVSKPQAIESTKMPISYIVHTITNEIIEIKFPDEASRNQWLVLVHTHITPFIEENMNKEDMVDLKPPPLSDQVHDGLKISSDLAGLIYSFNNLIQNQIHSVNLMRSASSAGETITKAGLDTQISIPKRAETFNGASSSKESQMSIININSDLFQKSKVFQTMGQKNCETLSTTTNTESDYSTTTNRSGDSGYQSKSCCIYADLDQSVTQCSNCTDKHVEIRSKVNVNENVQVVPRTSFETMLKTILNDYTKTKRENMELRKSIENKDKSIELLKKALDEYKVSF